MIYFDTNVLIYASVNQNYDKLKFSQKILMDAINSNTILISPLVIQEYVYTLNKLKVDSKVVYDNSRVFEFYCKYYIDSLLVSSATALASKINYFSNINDILHLKFAENYCSKLITYDSDFNKFKQFSKIEIDILE